MNTPMVDKVAEWLDWLSIDYAKTTIAAYEWELRHLEKWSMLVLDRPVLDLSKADLARYLAQRRAIDNVGDACIRRAVNAFRSFYSHTFGRKSPARLIPSPSVKRKRQRTLNRTQAFEVMLSADTSRPRGKRNLALVCLALSSGLREAELCRLRLSEIDLKRGCLTTKVKGGDDGDGVFGPDTASAIESWLRIRPGFAAPGVDAVFVSVGGNTPGMPLTPSGLRVIFRQIGREAGLEKLSPHDLRRSFATLSHRFGAPSRIVQVAGRWHDLAQVEGYTQALEAEDFAPYDPVSRIMGTNLDP
jgi:integrase/recombinase XerD